MGKLIAYEASTLVETIIALVIASVLFGLSALLLTNLWNSSATAQEMIAEMLVKSACGTPEKLAEMNQVEGVYLLSTTETWKRDGALLHTVIATNASGDTLATARKILLVP